MSSKPILYYLVLSPPARACALTAAALGVELELKNVDLLGRDNFKPDFLKVRKTLNKTRNFVYKEIFLFR